MSSHIKRSRSWVGCLGVVLAAVLCAFGVLPTAVHAASNKPMPAPATPAAVSISKRARYNQKEEIYFERRYGIGQLRVSSIAAGASLEFRCQVLDAQKAKALDDRRVAPVVIERKSGKKLSLATTGSDGNPVARVTPEAGRENSLVFGNPGMLVKPGNMVDLIIGTVHISGLIVE
jgi:hypothetical protein